MKVTFSDDPTDAIADAFAALLEEAEQRGAADTEVTAHLAKAGPFDLPLTMTVCDIHNRWHQHIALADEWENLYAGNADRLRKELAATPKGERNRRRELNTEIQRLTEIGKSAHQRVYGEFEDAQMAMQEVAEARAADLLSAAQPKLKGRKLENAIEDALLHFNELWGDRCYLEMTWRWTLDKCLTTALFGPEDKVT
jgi:hypothetical protein